MTTFLAVLGFVVILPLALTVGAAMICVALEIVEEHFQPKGREAWHAHLGNLRAVPIHASKLRRRSSRSAKLQRRKDESS